MYDTLAKLQAQNKKIILCKVPAHSETKGYEKADKAAKQAIDMPEMTTTRLPYTDYYLTFRKVRNLEWQKKWENSNSKLYDDRK